MRVTTSVAAPGTSAYHSVAGTPTVDIGDPGDQFHTLKVVP
jgi:hypothetical protein